MKLTVDYELVGHSVVAEGIFHVAGVLAGIGAVHLLDEERSLGQLSQAIRRGELYTSDFPGDLGCGNSDSQTGEFYVLLVRSHEFVVEGGYFGRHC